VTEILALRPHRTRSQKAADGPPRPPVTDATRRRNGAQRATRGPADRPRNFLTLTEFLDELDVPRSTFFRWKALGEAPRTYKLPNGQLRIRRTDYEAWLAEREEASAA
jgi:predicted DNA-binding transcriptional regulator AlpA